MFGLNRIYLTFGPNRELQPNLPDILKAKGKKVLEYLAYQSGTIGRMVGGSQALSSFLHQLNYLLI